jgi:hypothetical protein
MDIPIVVVCYNNYKYVENMIKQIKNINLDYYRNIIIMDNASICEDTRKFLDNTDARTLRLSTNYGPWISDSINANVYNSLPSKFILTDPDLELNKNLPNNFIEILSELSDKYGASKIGFALDISDFDKMFQSNDYFANKSVYDFESQYWVNKIESSKYELYYANIDTTFCLINKYYPGGNIRVAGNFTARHLPWYIDNKIYNIYETYSVNSKQTIISTIKKIIDRYISESFVKIHRQDELFLLPKHNENLDFWENKFSTWKENTFVILDKYLDKSKIFIDIGAWIGATAMYASRKSKHIYCIEEDKKSFNDLSENLKNNCETNYTLIDKPIYAKDVYTLDDIIEQYSINPSDISLIKVDIEGGEENILGQLYAIHSQHNVPVYITFNYERWNDKDLNRFEFLSADQKSFVQNNPLGSMLL